MPNTFPPDTFAATNPASIPPNSDPSVNIEAAIIDILHRHRDGKLGLAEAGRSLMRLFGRDAADGLEQPLHWVLLEHRAALLDDHRAAIRLLNLSRFTPATTSIADYMALIGRFY